MYDSSYVFPFSLYRTPVMSLVQCLKTIVYYVCLVSVLFIYLWLGENSTLWYAIMSRSKIPLISLFIYLYLSVYLIFINFIYNHFTYLLIVFIKWYIFFFFAFFCYVNLTDINLQCNPGTFYLTWAFFLFICYLNIYFQKLFRLCSHN